MKLNHYFSVNEVETKIVTASVTVSLDNAGIGIVEVIADKPLSGEVIYYFGNWMNMKAWFTGDIVNSTVTSAKTQRLLIHERGERLNQSFPLFLRNTTPRDILISLCPLARIMITADDGDWLKKPIPHFCALGTGLDTLLLLKRESGIGDFVILNNPDGSVYLGSYEKSNYAKPIVAFPESMFQDVSVVGATVAAIPGMRPGHQIKIGDVDSPRMVESIMLSGSYFRLNFKGDES